MKKLILLASLIAAVSAASSASAADGAKDKKTTKPAVAANAADSTGAGSQAATPTISTAGSPTGRAADWRPINNDGNTEMSLDVMSIREIGSMREVWAMWNFKDARPNKGDPTFPTLKSYQDMYIINCTDKTMRLSKEIIYAENYGAGDKRDHSDALTNMPYEKPAYDTVAETMVTEVCNYKIPKR